MATGENHPAKLSTGQGGFFAFFATVFDFLAKYLYQIKKVIQIDLIFGDITYKCNLWLYKAILIQKAIIHYSNTVNLFYYLNAVEINRNWKVVYTSVFSPLNPWVEIHNRAEFGAGIGFAAFE